MLEYLENQEEYKLVLGTKSVPDSFKRLNIEASNYINFHTHGRVDPKKVTMQVKYVTCLIINLIHKSEQSKEEIGNLKSQNLKGWSESYTTPEEIDEKLEKDKYSILSKYLTQEIGIDGKPLLYSGVC